MATKKTPARSVTHQRIHDMVIASLASQYQARGYTVHTNPNQQKNWSIGGVYPDVVVIAKSAEIHRLVIEVETGESVRESEAARQWVVDDDRYGAWLLAVPRHMRAAAKRLMEAHALRNVRLVTWSIDFAGLPR